MKQTYEKPVFLKHHNGRMNKFGSASHSPQNVCADIDGMSVDALADRYGSPLFVFSEKRLRRQVRAVRRAFTTRYPDVKFGWSYKTNYLSAICAVMHQEGALAEVVSGMEYDKARKLGVPGENIIFNGPYKKPADLERAARQGAMIHIDHLDEVADLEAMAEKLNRPVPVALRLNMDTGIQPRWSRFGFNLDNGQALAAARGIARNGRLLINGLHCHIGTFIMDPKAYAVQIEKMVKFMYELQEQFGFRVEYLDIGGGLPSRNRLKGVYLSPDVALPPMDEYAETVTDALFANLRPGHTPRLILEPGRALVDESGFLITTVSASRRMPDGRRAYVLDAGVNLLFTSNWYKFNIRTSQPVSGVHEPAVLYGPLCMNIDVVDEALMLPPLSRGVRLVVAPVGAYNVTQWMQFIQYRPAVVMIGGNGECDVIREGEDLSDIDRRERLPERLRFKKQSPARVVEKQEALLCRAV